MFDATSSPYALPQQAAKHARAISPSYIHVPLPADHRFPMAKYSMVATQLKQRGWHILDAPFARDEELERVHEASYLHALRQQTLDRKAVRTLGFPLTAELYQRSLASVGGTLAALHDALERGFGVNLAGGTHHAYAAHGEGFCVYNDIAVASRYALSQNLAERILVIDLDVHQGNGTANIFQHDPRVTTVSVHGARNYPFHKETSDFDVPLADGITDATYLAVLERTLDALAMTDVDVVFYQAGVDVLQGDRFGRMALSPAGVIARDQRVLEHCANVPLVYMMGGGYHKDINVTVDTHVRSLTNLWTHHSAPHPSPANTIKPANSQTAQEIK
jgi:acetoin utilization deacetylase AcuC-like enzyme